MRPRAHTVEEMRTMVLEHLRVMAQYWATTDLTRPEFQKLVAQQGETLYRLEGLVFSFLVMLDGGTGLPAFDLSPSPHPDDKQFHKDQGTNWWPKGVVINDTQLHEMWSAMGGDE